MRDYVITLTLPGFLKASALAEGNFASKYDELQILVNAVVLPTKTPVPETVLKLCFLSIYAKITIQNISDNSQNLIQYHSQQKFSALLPESHLLCPSVDPFLLVSLTKTHYKSVPFNNPCSDSPFSNASFCF